MKTKCPNGGWQNGKIRDVWWYSTSLYKPGTAYFWTTYVRKVNSHLVKSPHKVYDRELNKHTSNFLAFIGLILFWCFVSFCFPLLKLAQSHYFLRWMMNIIFLRDFFFKSTLKTNIGHTFYKVNADHILYICAWVHLWIDNLRQLDIFTKFVLEKPVGINFIFQTRISKKRVTTLYFMLCIYTNHVLTCLLFD